MPTFSYAWYFKMVPSSFSLTYDFIFFQLQRPFWTDWRTRWTGWRSISRARVDQRPQCRYLPSCVARREDWYRPWKQSSPMVCDPQECSNGEGSMLGTSLVSVSSHRVGDCSFGVVICGCFNPRFRAFRGAPNSFPWGRTILHRHYRDPGATNRRIHCHHTDIPTWQ